MKKRTVVFGFIIGGCVLLGFLLLVLFILFRMNKPQYVTPEIPMPQYLPAYAGKNAVDEEFSTFVETNTGYRYFVYRMYVSVRLGHQPGFEPEFETENDVENYYDEWLKNLGWEEDWKGNSCDAYMTEFQPVESYRAYTNRHNNATACLVTWFESGDGDHLNAMIKTINPSWEVLWDSD